MRFGVHAYRISLYQLRRQCPVDSRSRRVRHARPCIVLLEPLVESEGPMTIAYELRCRECGKTYGNQPLSICDECFSPLEVDYDLEYARTHVYPRDDCAGSVEHVALSGAAAGSGRLCSADAGGMDAAGEGSAAGAADWREAISTSRTTPSACLR